MNISLHKPVPAVSGDIYLPGSKSISNRVLMIRALSGSAFTLENMSDSDDTRHLLDALNAISTGSSTVIDIGHAGTDMRFLTAYLSMQKGSYELTGSERMQQRPIGELVQVLRLLGADITCKNKEGFPPLLISGKELKGGQAEIRGDISSQFITALLMISPYFEKGLELKLRGNIVSKPYILMTIETMKQFGAEVIDMGDMIRVEPLPYGCRADSYHIESDWSAASYYYSMVALSAPGTSLTLHGLFEKSLQADAACAGIYRQFGVETLFSGQSVTISRTREMPAEKIVYDFTRCPDIAQTLACSCVALGRPFEFKGLQTLKVKETDRIFALKTEFEKFGLHLNATADTLTYDGSAMQYEGVVQIATYNDHRMAMSFAPMSLLHAGISIGKAEVVSKSYPGFWDDLRNIGFVIDPE